MVFEDGSIIYGYGYGAPSIAMGELCFNTSMTGYQEIITDPSYKGQIVTFTFPHIGNVGTNELDYESHTSCVEAIVTREPITPPANWRCDKDFNEWLVECNIPAIYGVDTRFLTKKIRDIGNLYVVVAHDPTAEFTSEFSIESLIQTAKNIPHLNHLDLAQHVTCQQQETWNTSVYNVEKNHYLPAKNLSFNVAVMDYGVKHNILRLLTYYGCNITLYNAKTPAEDILKTHPDGVFLSNGPGDPEATGCYAVPYIQEFIKANIPIFGICLGHQMLSIALGARTKKMRVGHRGANHPVKNLQTGSVHITSQNHGFAVDDDGLPNNIIVTHRSLFDDSIAGIQAVDKPFFSVQYHPEASPGPQDNHDLFQQFTRFMQS